MGCRGQAVDVELFAQPAYRLAGLVGSDQLDDFGGGQKSLSHLR